MQDVLDFLWNNWGAIATILLLLSELLGSIDFFKSSSVFQLVVNLIQKFAPKK